MRKLKFISLTVFVLILATSCERKEDETKAQEQIQVETEKPTQKQQELSEEVLQNLVDMGDKEDLIASGKIKPAPEFVEIDGKMVRTSPEEYKSKDGCEKARELYLYRMENKLFRYEELECQSGYLFPNTDTGGNLCVMKDYKGVIVVDNFSYNTEFFYKIYDKVVKTKNKDVYFAIYNYKFKSRKGILFNWKIYKIIKNNINLPKEDYGYAWIDLKDSDIKKYLFLKQKDCIATFYRGEEF